MLIDKTNTISPLEKSDVETMFLASIGTADKKTKVRYYCPTVFIFYDHKMKPLFVGKTTNIRKSYSEWITGSSKEAKEIQERYSFIGLIFVKEQWMMDLYEIFMIELKCPKFNPPSFAREKDEWTIHNLTGHKIYSSLSDISGSYKEYIFSKDEVEDFALPKHKKKPEPKVPSAEDLFILE